MTENQQLPATRKLLTNIVCSEKRCDNKFSILHAFRLLQLWNDVHIFDSAAFFFDFKGSYSIQNINIAILQEIIC